MRWRPGSCGAARGRAMRRRRSSSLPSRCAPSVVLAPPYLSSDIYRYVWDGRVIAAGINPYGYVPNDPHLAALRDPDIFPEINRGNYARTIYPPAAQAIFFLVTRLGESLTVMKLAMVGFEAIAVVLMLRLLAAAGRPASWIAVYAWNPLPLWEFAGSGHIDAAMIAFVALALWSRRTVADRARAGRRRVGEIVPGRVVAGAVAALGLADAGAIRRRGRRSRICRLPGPARMSSAFCRAMRPRKGLPAAPAFIGGTWRNPCLPLGGVSTLPYIASPRRVCSPRSPFASLSGRRGPDADIRRRGAARRGVYRAADAALSVVFLLACRFRLSGGLAGAGMVDGGKFRALLAAGLAASGVEYGIGLLSSPPSMCRF